MENWGVLAFVLAIGFATSGLMSAIHINAIGSPAEFRLWLTNPLAVAYSFFVCMVAGPYIIATKSLSYWREGYLPNSVFGICLMLAVAWSFCSGILIAEGLRLCGFVSI